MAKKKQDWVVVNYSKDPVVMECRRCTDTAPMPSKCSLTFASEVMLLFARLHKDCEEMPNTDAVSEGKGEE